MVVLVPRVVRALLVSLSTKCKGRNPDNWRSTTGPETLRLSQLTQEMLTDAGKRRLGIFLGMLLGGAFELLLGLLD